MDDNLIKQLVEQAVEALKRENLKDIHEQTVTGRLMIHLDRCFPPRNYNVDVEYNKNVDNPKRLDGELVRPDILVHKRGNNSGNILVVEAKKRYLSKKDKEKLVKFTKQSGAYKYQIGLGLEIKNINDELSFNLRWYRDGQEE